jgi:hypothetical protein
VDQVSVRLLAEMMFKPTERPWRQAQDEDGGRHCPPNQGAVETLGTPRNKEADKEAREEEGACNEGP